MTRFPAVALQALAGVSMTIAAVIAEPAEAVNIKDVTSPGGINAWLVEDYTVPIVTMNFAFRGSASQEPAEQSGLANLLSGMLDEGAGDLDSRAFQERLQETNVNLSFDAGRDAFYGNMRTLQSNMDEAFELTRLAITEPRFDEEPVQRIKGQIISGLKRGQTDPQEIARKAFAKSLFGDHPYGQFVEGSPETVGALTGADLAAFHKRIMAKDNLHVAVVGAISEEELGAALDRIFGGLPEKADLRPVPEIMPDAGKREHVALGVPQTVIRIGGAGMKRDDPDFIAAYIANHILGGGTFSSRLYNEIREKRGLAYSVGTGLIPYDHSGAYVAAAATRADAADEAIAIMKSEIERYAAEGPTAEELDKAKAYLTGNYALRFDASRKIARQLIGIQIDNLGIDYIAKRNSLIEAVTLDDVKRAAKRLFGGPISVVTVGTNLS
jgi:zinc protease